MGSWPANGLPDSELQRSEMTTLYIILAVLFVVLLFAYVRVRGRRIHN